MSHELISSIWKMDGDAGNTVLRVVIGEDLLMMGLGFVIWHNHRQVPREGIDAMKVEGVAEVVAVGRSAVGRKGTWRQHESISAWRSVVES
jgi:hypothetical protein